METYVPDQTCIMRSLPKSIGLLIVGSVFVVGGIWLVYDGYVDTKSTSTVVLGWLSVLFFGMSSALILYRLIFGSNTPVILSQTGFVDKRLFRGEIPWSEIARVSVFSYRKASQIRMELTYEGINSLDLTWSTKIIGWINKPFSSDMLYITSSELDISFPEFWIVMRRYVTEFCPHALDSEQ